MVRKQMVGIKLPEEEVRAFKNQAAMNHTTVTDLIAESLRNRLNQGQLQQKIADLEAELQDLKQRHEAMTGKKLASKKRVSFSLSVAEFNTLNMLAAKKTGSKSKLLHDLIFPESEQRALVEL